MSRTTTLTTAAIICIQFAHAASAQNLLSNGGFELPGFAGAYLDVSPGSTTIPGWTVGTAGGINIIGTLWPASEGTNCIDLRSGGTGPGSISQVVPLTKDTTYRISFDLAYNTDWGLPVTLKVTAGDFSRTFVRDAGSALPFWQRESFTFTPTNDTVSVISFEDITGGPIGSPEVALDNVVLERESPHLTIRVSQVELCWASNTNASYQLQYRSVLTTNSWINLGPPISGDGQIQCVPDAVPPAEPHRFYRVRLLP